MRIKQLQYHATPNRKVFAKYFGRVLILLICVLCIMVAGFYSKHSYYKIYGASMQPTIASQGYSCFINTTAPYTYGDIVIAYDPALHSSPVIKRVIAMGGDMVGYIYNQEKGYHQILLFKASAPTEPIILDEPYLYSGITDPAMQHELLQNTAVSRQNFLTSTQDNPSLCLAFMFGQPISLLILEENTVFLLGDNRKVSIDSSSYGAVETTAIRGKVEYIFKDSISTFQIALKDIFGL